MFLPAPGICYSWESCVFYIVYNQPRKLFCPFFKHFLVYTTTAIGHWFLYALKWTIYYFIYKIKGNIGTVSHQTAQRIIQNWPRYLLCFWCCVLWLKIVCLLCIVDSVPFHWPHDTVFKQGSFKHVRRLLKTITGKVNVFASASAFSDRNKCAARPRKCGTITRKFVCVQPFSSAYQYPSIQF